MCVGGGVDVTRQVNKIGFNYKSGLCEESSPSFPSGPRWPLISGNVLCWQGALPSAEGPASLERRLDKLPYWFPQPAASPTKSIYQRPQFCGLGLFIFSNNEPRRVISCCTCKSMDPFDPLANDSSVCVFHDVQPVHDRQAFVFFSKIVKQRIILLYLQYLNLSFWKKKSTRKR